MFLVYSFEEIFFYLSSGHLKLLEIWGSEAENNGPVFSFF
jgi:hypothetical protein